MEINELRSPIEIPHDHEGVEYNIRPTRIGNIAFRVSKTIGSHPRDYVDIVLWYPNPDYGQEDQYKKVDKEWYIPKEGAYHYRKHESCFKNPENCYTVATIDIKEEPNILSVGLRPFDLKPKDRADFEAIVRLAYEYTVNLWREQNNY